MACNDNFNFVTTCFLFLILVAGEDGLQTTEQPLVGVYMPQTMIPPKITLISHTLTGDTIDVPTDSPIQLRCTGQRPMVWIFPHNHATWVILILFYVLFMLLMSFDKLFR